MLNSKTFLGTAAAGVMLGFANRPPDWCYLTNLVAGLRIEWSRNNRAVETAAGHKITESTGAITALTYKIGIEPSDGGDSADGTAAFQVFDGFDQSLPQAFQSLDKRLANAANGAAPINKWTLDVASVTTTKATGHFNANANTTHVGIGSVIRVKENGSLLTKTGVILAFANNGAATGEVGLSRNIGTGVIEYIGPKYDFIAAPAGLVMPAGIIINETAVNAANMCRLDYGWFDTPAFPD